MQPLEIVLVIVGTYLQNLANTSADNTAPTIFPKCGTLFTYGKAEVIRTFRSPFIGKTFSPFRHFLTFFNGVFQAFLAASSSSFDTAIESLAAAPVSSTCLTLVSIPAAFLFHNAKFHLFFLFPKYTVM